MLTGKKLVLATRKFAKENTKLSWFYTIQIFSFLISTLTLIILSNNFIIQCVFSVLSGLLIVRAFVIYHDYMHESILRKSKIAKYVFRIFGILILAPQSVWKSSHNFHHQNNSKLRYSSIGSYPIQTKSEFLQNPVKLRRKYLFSRHPITIVFGYIFTFIIGMCLIPIISNYKKHSEAVLALLIHFVIYYISFNYLGLSKTLFLVTLPNFIAGCIGSYLFYIQHNFPNTTFKNDSKWSYEDAAMESSSFLIASPVIHWFSANIGYHHIHHLNARIPFYRLPETMKFFPELQNPKTVTLSISDVRTCLCIKVWDTDIDKMVHIKLNKT